ncbi:MAG: hypothetical protein NUV59_03715 [Patescibacteria group bacterium]|nr:hypothetical protein [Patescibacteria group bacterium]
MALIIETCYLLVGKRRESEMKHGWIVSLIVLLTTATSSWWRPYFGLPPFDVRSQYALYFIAGAFFSLMTVLAWALSERNTKP